MKKFLILMVLCATLGFAVPADANEYSYAGDPGFVAKTPGEMAAAKSSWETAQYLRSGGLAHMNASTAYALGYFGQDRTIGVMDSGSLSTHPAFQNIVNADGTVVKSWTFVTQEGVYSTSGERYRGAGANFTVTGNQGAPYTAGDPFYVTGAYDSTINDSHGTSVTGIVSANRNGDTSSTAMHGISWGSNMVIGNTGATDNNNYGPYQDPNFFYTSFKAMVDAGAEVINNSWGTNIRINLTQTASYPYGLTTAEGGRTDGSIQGMDGGNVGNMLWSNNVPQAEYEYFYWKKVQGDYNWMDATYDAVKGTNVVYIMTTGNRDNANPFYRALYPYFNPEAEKHWIAAAGIRQISSTNTNLTLVDTYGEAGLAKWWTVVGYTLTNAYTTNLTGGYGTGSFSGTSCSAPHIAGAMGVLLSRYQNMDATQVRDVMFTTASRHNADGTLYAGWTSAEGVPDERYGWGMPDLDKGMYGPGQFLGRLAYNASVTPLDVWTNDISNAGLDARKAEDVAWLAVYKATLASNLAGLGLYNNGQDARGGILAPGTTEEYAATGDYFLGDTIVVMDNDADNTNHIITQEEAEAWRSEYATKRAEDIENKLANNLYEGSLVKQGPGTLVMTGDNTYKGGTTIENGVLYGFTESFGTGTVNVNGGYFGILSGYNDLFTMKGPLTSTQSHLADISVNSGGTYVIVTGNDVNVGSLAFNSGSKLTIAAADTDLLREVFENRNLTATGTVTSTALIGIENMRVDPDYAFFNMDVRVAQAAASSPAATITGTLSWNDATLASFADNRNGRAIANVISTNIPNELMDSLLWATKDEVSATLNTLSNDMYLNADSNSIINSLTLSRAIKNEALGIGSGCSTKVSETARIWATGVGSLSSVDFGRSDHDGEFYASFIGVETNVTPNNTLGLFFGAGSSEFRGGRYGKIESDDLHIGAYGVSKIADVAALTYGVMHTRQDRDMRRTLTVVDQTQRNAVSTDTNITQFFAEAAYTQFCNDMFSIEPYVGINVMRLKTDGFKERVNNYEFSTGSNKQTLGAATLGLRGSVPVLKRDALSLAVRGDVAGTTFMGDTTPEAYMQIAGLGSAKIKGGELDPMLNFGLGLDAKFGESVKFSLSYVGAFNDDIQSNGIVANFRINF